MQARYVLRAVVCMAGWIVVSLLWLCSLLLHSTAALLYLLLLSVTPAAGWRTRLYSWCHKAWCADRAGKSMDHVDGATEESNDITAARLITKLYHHAELPLLLLGSTYFIELHAVCEYHNRAP